jgi:hypothetical protein
MKLASPVLILLFLIPALLASVNALENLPVCTAADGQILPRSIGDGNGGLVIVWEDYRTGVDWDVYAQRISASGATQWNADAIPICREQDNQRYLRMTQSGEQVVIAWTDRRSRRSWDVYAQAIDMSGKTLWGARGAPVCVHPADQSTIEVMSDGAGGVIIIWEDERRSSEFQDLYLQRFDASGKPMWEVDGIPVFPSDTLQSNPKLIPDDAGGFYVVWWDVIGYDQWHIMAHRLDLNGKSLWKAPMRVSPEEGLQGEPLAVSDGQGGVIVVWQNYDNFVNDDFFAQRIDRAGNKLWSVNGVVVCNAPGAQKHASMASDGEGGFVAVWTDERDVFSDLYSQRIRSDGKPAWQMNGVPICVAGGRQDKPFIIRCNDKEFLVAWLDYREDFGEKSSDAIYGQKIDLSGRTLWEDNGMPICTAGGAESPPYIAQFDSGELAIVWSDGRNDLGDIYVQCVK